MTITKIIFALIFLVLVAASIWFIAIGVYGPLLATLPLSVLFGVFVYLDVRKVLKERNS